MYVSLFSTLSCLDIYASTYIFNACTLRYTMYNLHIHTVKGTDYVFSGAFETVYQVIIMHNLSINLYNAM